MKIKITEAAVRGIGLRSNKTKELKRYIPGDVVEVPEKVALGIISSGFAEEASEEPDAKAEGETSGEPDAKAEGEASEEPDVKSMTVDELREECEKRGLDSSGKKKELLARLETA